MAHRLARAGARRFAGHFSSSLDRRSRRDRPSRCRAPRPACSAGRQHRHGRGSDPAGRRLGATAVDAAHEPHPLDQRGEPAGDRGTGVVLADLHDEAHDVGMRFPLTLGARGSCTIDGPANTNAGGTQVLELGRCDLCSRGSKPCLPRIGPPRPVQPQEGQPRLQPRPTADRQRRNARSDNRGRAAAGSGGRDANGRLEGDREPGTRARLLRFLEARTD